MRRFAEKKLEGSGRIVDWVGGNWNGDADEVVCGISERAETHRMRAKEKAEVRLLFAIAPYCGGEVSLQLASYL